MCRNVFLIHNTVDEETKRKFNLDENSAISLNISNCSKEIDVL